MQSFANNNQSLNADNSRDLFVLFSFTFGFYLGIHMLLVQEISPSWFNFVPVMAGFWLMLKPDSVTRFMIAAMFSLTDTWIAMPLRSNSTMLTLLMLLFIVVAFVGLVWRHRTLKVDGGELFDHFASGGRLVLLIMYFFGIFQKLNQGFLDPEVSCAAVMMRHYAYLPQEFVTHPMVQYTGIAGTFLIEAIILLGLIFARTRYFAIVLGVAFHAFLSLSTFQYFQPFTMMAILLHFLFLDRGTLDHWRSSFIGKLVTQNTIMPRTIPVLWILLWVSFVWFWMQGGKTYPYIVWFPIISYILAFVILHGKGQGVPIPAKEFFRPKNPVILALCILFFVQCFSPYAGFKTQQTVNMFSNLRTEGGQSNHLVFTKPWNLFPYQNELVTVIGSDDPHLQNLAQWKNKMVAVDFFNYIARRPRTKVTYEYQGKTTTLDGLSADQIADWKLPLLAHKFMVFETVPTTRKMPCLAD